jgi:indole-3-glycerol phosphate synthase
MSFLTEILARKRDRVNAAKQIVSLGEVREFAEEVRSNALPHLLLRSLQRNGVNVIAEFKRKSPSKGVIREKVDLRATVRSYEAGGAAAISVLTEQDYFAGSLDDLRSVKSTVKLPVLRKDFIFDEYQIFESAAAGADAILLIVAALDDETLERLRRLAEEELGMDALVEVHDKAEMKRAAGSGAKLIGVNNRNLHTFEVSIDTSLALASAAPSESTLISESGLQSAADLAMLRSVGYRGFLIGESLMRAEKPEEILFQFLLPS